MFFRILTPLFCAAAIVISAHPMVDFLHEKHLDTKEGRASFLSEKLSPYIAEADQIHQKIQALSLEGSTLSPENDQAKILEIAQKVADEMAKLSPMLSILQQCTFLEGDFEQIDAILQNPEAISPEQEEVLQRIQTIYSALGSVA